MRVLESWNPSFGPLVAFTRLHFVLCYINLTILIIKAKCYWWKKLFAFHFAIAEYKQFNNHLLCQSICIIAYPQTIILVIEKEWSMDHHFSHLASNLFIHTTVSIPRPTQHTTKNKQCFANLVPLFQTFAHLPFFFVRLLISMHCPSSHLFTIFFLHFLFKVDPNS